MEREHALGGLGGDVVALVGQRRRQPEGLASPFLIVDVDVSSSLIGEHERDQPGSDNEPDDEQPPIELGVHRREV